MTQVTAWSSPGRDLQKEAAVCGVPTADGPLLPLLLLSTERSGFALAV